MLYSACLAAPVLAAVYVALLRFLYAVLSLHDQEERAVPAAAGLGWNDRMSLAPCPPMITVET